MTRDGRALDRTMAHSGNCSKAVRHDRTLTPMNNPRDGPDRAAAAPANLDDGGILRHRILKADWCVGRFWRSRRRHSAPSRRRYHYWYGEAAGDRRRLSAGGAASVLLPPTLALPPSVSLIHGGLTQPAIFEGEK